MRLFEYLLAENGSLLDLIAADYGLLTERLARHYEMTEDGSRNNTPEGNGWSSNPERSRRDEFRRLTFPDDRRGGVLGMGGVHLLTSYPDRTSPVLRGGWVLETLLGVRVPSPPPDVPALNRSRKEAKSVREQLAEHRDHTACAACHILMDPLGFALDNFDVLSRWRDVDGKSPVDASATLPSGEHFAGPGGLKQVLLARKDQFLHQLTRKLLGYATGRSLNESDDCTISRIAETVKADEYRARTLVREVVLSTPFRMRQLPQESRSPVSLVPQHGEDDQP